jgi:hypothetical protein
MKLSAFNSFIACLKIKTGMYGARSKRFSMFNPCLAAVLVSMAVIAGFTLTRRQASAQASAPVKVMRIPVKVTAADGVKSIRQLIAENGPIIPYWPNQPVQTFHFLVSGDPTNSNLVLPGIPGAQPQGYQLGIPRGGDLRLTLPKLPMNVETALSYAFNVRTAGTCNFLLVLELYEGF